jgi:hypothetical protein
MRCQNSSLRPNEMGCSSSRRKETPRPPHRLGRKCDPPQGIGMKCRNPSLHPNEMSELIPVSEGNGMLLIASEGRAAPPHRFGRQSDARQAPEWDVGAPHCVAMRCLNSSLRSSEMGCPSSHRKGRPHRLTASGENGMPLGHRSEMSEPPTASQ